MLKLSNKLLGLLFLFISNIFFGQTFPVKAIIDNGPRDKRINIVFLGDGYQITEMQKYQKDVQLTVDKIFQESPYKEYKSLFNVFAIEVPSNESGTDHPGTAADCNSYKDSVFTRDTYFDTSFDAGSIHRLLISKDYNHMLQVLQDNLPEYDIVLMVVNHNWYGGSGGSIAVFSANSVSSEVAIHETGHSFARLADEYDYGYPQPARYDGINVTFRTNRDSIPWKLWIDPFTPIPTPVSGEYVSTIGLFEGAYYSSKGMYRPKMSCKMRDLGVPFCEICIEQHVKSIFERLELIEKYAPLISTVDLLTNEKMDFSIHPLQLGLNGMSSEWQLDDKLLVSNVNTVQIDGALLSVGLHKLTAVVKHSSSLVKNDPYGLMQSSKKWTIDVKTPTDIATDDIPNKFSLEQNYPNPFNPATTINYNIAEPGNVVLKVYDVLGSEVAELVNERKDRGKHSVVFNAGKFASGLYIYSLRVNGYFSSRVMLLTK